MDSRTIIIVFVLRIEPESWVRPVLLKLLGLPILFFFKCKASLTKNDLHLSFKV